MEKCISLEQTIIPENETFCHQSRWEFFPRDEDSMQSTVQKRTHHEILTDEYLSESSLFQRPLRCVDAKTVVLGSGTAFETKDQHILLKGNEYPNIGSDVGSHN